MITTKRDSERIQKLRDAHEAWQQTAEAGRVFCIDETGSTVAMPRTRGRAPRGRPVQGRVPRCRGKVITIIGALTLQGLVAVMTVLGGTSGDVFLAYVREVLGPELKPGDLVVLDNLGAHRNMRVRAEIESHGAKLIFQPPYSPDKNPIELTWAWLKRYLRTAEARSREAIDPAIAWAMEVLPKDAPSAWFRRCGFVNQ